MLNKKKMVWCFVRKDFHLK